MDAILPPINRDGSQQYTRRRRRRNSCLTPLL